MIHDSISVQLQMNTTENIYLFASIKTGLQCAYKTYPETSLNKLKMNI